MEEHIGNSTEAGDMEEVLDGYSFVQKLVPLFTNLSLATSTILKEKNSENASHILQSNIVTLEKILKKFGTNFDKLQAENDQLNAKLLKEKKRCSLYVSKLIKYQKENAVRKMSSTANKSTLTNEPIEEIPVSYLSLKDAKDALAAIKQLVNKREDRGEFNKKKIIALSRTVEELKEKNQTLANRLKEQVGDENETFDFDQYVWS